MADKLIVEPDAVTGFARDLRNYANQLDTGTSRMASRLSSLHSHWHDAKYAKFSGEMKELAGRVKKARLAVIEYANHLDTFAERVRAAGATKI